MKYALSLFLLLSILFSCHKDEVGSSVSSCAHGELTRTTQFIRNVPATIVAVKSPITSGINFEIMRGSTAAPLSSCGLPASLAKDSLKVTVSGYLLTFLGIEFVNIRTLPFEVTDAKLRQ